jgi:hypothetical protein
MSRLWTGIVTAIVMIIMGLAGVSVGYGIGQRALATIVCPETE